MKNQKVILGMSGGVDSSVAAHLLKQQGYDVIGVYMCLGTVLPGADDETRHSGCCSPESAQDARHVAQRLKIPFYTLDLSEAMKEVIAYFAGEYRRGRTPNPCAMCNPKVKIARLIQYADTVGATFVATGHYARTVADARGCGLARARNRAKDQSYVLFGLAPNVLARLRLPIGEIEDKACVREIAHELGLSVAEKPDSQEICFVPKGHYTDLLRKLAPEAFRPGPIINQQKQVVGMHEGTGNFTLGQRRRLRLAAGEPLYVTAIDVASGAVTIGPRSAVKGRELLASGANWHVDVGNEPFHAVVQIRYNNPGALATVQLLDGGRFTVKFDQPVDAITPGQVAAIYDGDRLLGGGWIDSTD